MKVSEFIKQMEPYKDFDMETVVHLKVSEEELQKRTYKYPADSYRAELDIDDVGHSDRALVIGVSILPGEEERTGTGGWIPCSERLPEESLNSVIGWDEVRERCCFVHYYTGRWILGDDTDFVVITAWQPVPEPYRKE